MPPHTKQVQIFGGWLNLSGRGGQANSTVAPANSSTGGGDDMCRKATAQDGSGGVAAFHFIVDMDSLQSSV